MYKFSAVAVHFSLRYKLGCYQTFHYEQRFATSSIRLSNFIGIELELQLTEV